MIAMVVCPRLGVREDAIGVSFDELYELSTRAIVDVWCDRGGFAGGAYAPDLSDRYVGDNRGQLAIFDFCFERVADGRDPNVLVEGTTGLLDPSDPVSICLDLVEVKVVAKPN